MWRQALHRSGTVFFAQRVYAYDVENARQTTLPAFVPTGPAFSKNTPTRNECPSFIFLTVEKCRSFTRESPWLPLVHASKNSVHHSGCLFKRNIGVRRIAPSPRHPCAWALIFGSEDAHTCTYRHRGRSVSTTILHDADTHSEHDCLRERRPAGTNRPCFEPYSTE